MLKTSETSSKKQEIVKVKVMTFAMAKSGFQSGKSTATAVRAGAVRQLAAEAVVHRSLSKTSSCVS